MNRYLASLLPYPFERLNALKAGLTSKSNHEHISLALGEPKHSPPQFIIDYLADAEALISGLSSYPATRGSDKLRESIANWLRRRYEVQLNPDTSVLPVNGTREGLFSFGQAVLSGSRDAVTVMPNPFYQIYEGAAKLRGSEPHYVASTQRPEFEAVPDEIWDRAELVYLCSPGNPTGIVSDREQLEYLIAKAQEHDFCIAADECYSEIYMNESQPPLGLLEVADSMGVDDFNRCVVFNSLSKRSNCPGLRSGFAAGDPLILEQFYHYRTYHGCAMPAQVQESSALAWADEEHVIANRAVYREKFQATLPVVGRSFGTAMPEGAFYYWLDVGVDDELFATELFQQENITVLPGKYLSRHVNGRNPGANHVRVALVAPYTECVEAIHRLCDFSHRLTT